MANDLPQFGSVIVSPNLKRLLLIGKMTLVEQLTDMISDNKIGMDTTIADLIELLDKEIVELRNTQA